MRLCGPESGAASRSSKSVWGLMVVVLCAQAGSVAFYFTLETGSEKQVVCPNVCGQCVSTFCLDFSSGSHLGGIQGWVYCH